MLVVAVGLVVAAALASLAYVVAAKRAASPDRELAAAMRLLDQILSYDEAVTALSPTLRDQAKALTSRCYKELRP